MNENKKIKRMQITAWILSIIPILMTAMFYSKLPAEIPMQWGLQGTVRYDAKSNLFVVAFMSVMIIGLLQVMPKIDPKKKNYEKFENSYAFLQCVIGIFFVCIVGMILIESFYPGTIDIKKVCIFIVGMLFMILGNMLPKFRQNFFCGIRTPWSISSESVWNKTNRLGGRMMFGAGLISLAGMFTTDVISMAILLTAILISVLVPSGMSYIWYKQENQK